MGFQIADLFEAAVDAVPDRLALVCGEERRTYRELDERSNQAAALLRDAGVGNGDFVGLYATNSAAHVELMMGAYKISAVPVNVNFRYVKDELRYLCRDAGLVALVHDADLAGRADAVADDVPSLATRINIGGAHAGAIDYETAVMAMPADRIRDGRSEDDLYVCYTGGTTGMPKGVVWRHADVFFALGGGFDAYTGEPVPDDHFLADKARNGEAVPLVSLSLPPLMHGGGQWGTMRFLFEGNAVILQPRFDPVDAWKAVEAEGITNIMMTGDAMARPLIEALRDLEAAGDVDLSSLFVIASTAVVFSRALKQQYLERFPNCIIIDSIGSTETGQSGMMTVGADSEMSPAGPNVAPSPEAVVLDDDLRPITAAAGGGTGKLARSGHIPLRYHNDPAKTAETFVTTPDGTRYSIIGDSARVEPDGSITLLGRDSVCINSGGEKIFTEEVEGVVRSHPAVYDAIVVGVPDERWGQRVAAVAELRPGAVVGLDELDRHCRDHLAGYKVPRQLTIVDRVQRSAAGKPDYRWATEVAEADTADRRPVA